ncbi:MAG: bifunctional 2-dehydro-3-deoxygluconokinase/2-dehydro-3-deoxygalactonokinase [Haloferacaceae archaeon]
MTDLVTFGESMLRLSPPAGERLARASAFDVHVGGAESNVAVAASHLGLDATWVSKLPTSPLGERVVYAVRGEGVTPAVVWTDAGRVGTYYLEPGGRPRGSDVVYDRAGAAVRDATADELPLTVVDDADAFYTSGITPALSTTLARTVETVLSRARDAGTTTYLDVNYRSKLWNADRARETLTDLFPAVDVLFVARRDAETVLGETGRAEATARTLRDRHGFDAVVVTRSSAGAVACHEGGVVEQDAFETKTHDPVGTGDAFVGGYVARRHRGGSVADALAYAAATASLKRTLDGDVAVVSPDEVAAVLDGPGDGVSR